MTLEEVKAALEKSGIPVAYRRWPEGKAPPLPFICYLAAYSNNFAADGEVYCPIQHIQVELYTKQKEPQTEDRVEKALSSFVWEKTENYIDSEKCYQIIYETEI